MRLSYLTEESYDISLALMMMPVWSIDVSLEISRSLSNPLNFSDSKGQSWNGFLKKRELIAGNFKQQTTWPRLSSISIKGYFPIEFSNL